MPLTQLEYQQFLQTFEQIKGVYEVLEKEVKKYGAESAELKEQHQRLETAMQRWEAKQQEPPKPSADESKQQRKDAFLKAMRLGYHRLDAEERKMVVTTNASDAPPIPALEGKEQKGLYVGDDTAGGFLAPPEFTTDIIKQWIPFSPIRQYVKVRTTSNRSVQFPKRVSTITAQWVGEKFTRVETTGYALGRLEIPTNEMYALVLVSEQDLEDVAFDLEGELRGEFSEQFGVAEGKAILSGDASLQPQGIL